MRVLFVTWDGPQVNYLESLFVPIFGGLRPFGIETSVVQFCPGFDGDSSPGAKACRAADIDYRAVAVSRKFGAAGAFAAALRGAQAVRAAAQDFRADAIMPRSHLPALAVLAAGTSRLPPIYFDADGLPAEERVEFRGLSGKGPTFVVLKAIETAIIRRSRGILVRSAFAKEYLEAQTDVPAGRFHVVRNGRDQDVFTPGTAQSRAATRQLLNVPKDAPLLIYVGSAGEQYRFDLISQAARAIKSRHEEARLLLLTGSPGEARQLLDPRVLDMTDVRTVPSADVPPLIAAADLGLSFRAKTLSMKAVSPIKLGEYLLCGIPVLGTSGIGDTNAAEQAGLFADETQVGDQSARWLLDQVLPQRASYRKAARAIGMKEFSLKRSIQDYLRLLIPLQAQPSKN